MNLQTTPLGKPTLGQSLLPPAEFRELTDGELVEIGDRSLAEMVLRNPSVVQAAKADADQLQSLARHSAIEKLRRVNERPSIQQGPRHPRRSPCVLRNQGPIRILIEHLEAGDRLDDFLDSYQTVSRERAIAVLETAKMALIGKPDEAVA